MSVVSVCDGAEVLHRTPVPLYERLFLRVVGISVSAK